MKQTNNNEVDLLLRSLAGGRGGSALQDESWSGDGNRASSDHLDADELNSYAEGVAPAAARARYTEHLADCDACRGIVVGLTQAAGAVTRVEVPEPKGLGFWTKLNTFFSPAVIRYAVPVLVLTAVIGISLLALWQPRRHDLIALNEPSGSSTTRGRLEPTGSSTGHQTSEAPVTMQKGLEAPAAEGSVTKKNSLENEKLRAGAAAGTSDNEELTRAQVAKDGAKPGETTTLSELRPSYAPEPKAAAPPPPQASQSEGDSIAFAKEQPAKREGQERQRDDAIRNQPSDEHGPNRSAAPNTARAPLAARRVGGLTAGSSGANTQNKTDKAGEVETRTVSGRRFAREGNAWVDTAYDSSRATINVARGSEQFRALVADEPGLGAIAQQLNGVVIVVWKNRVYRIQ
jgi:hypothetical protein